MTKRSRLDSSDGRWTTAGAADATALHLSDWQLQTVATADPMVITLQLLVAGPTPQSRLRTGKVRLFDHPAVMKPPKPLT